MKSKLKKTYIILALVFVFFASANVVGFFFATRHDGTANISKDMFAGKVFEITPDAISVIDAREVKRTFIVTKDTKIVEGKNILQTLDIEEGTFVLITSKQIPQSGDEAKEVRIVTTGTFKKNSK